METHERLMSASDIQKRDARLALANIFEKVVASYENDLENHRIDIEEADKFKKAYFKTTNRNIFLTFNLTVLTIPLSLISLWYLPIVIMFFLFLLAMLNHARFYMWLHTRSIDVQRKYYEFVFMRMFPRSIKRVPVIALFLVFSFLVFLHVYIMGGADSIYSLRDLGLNTGVAWLNKLLYANTASYQTMYIYPFVFGLLLIFLKLKEKRFI